LLHDLSLSLSLLRLLVLRLRLPPVRHHRTLSFFQPWYVGLVDPTCCKGFFGVFEKKEFLCLGFFSCAIRGVVLSPVVLFL
jgi:hypothetical protein